MLALAMRERADQAIAPDIAMLALLRGIPCSGRLGVVRRDESEPGKVPPPLGSRVSKDNCATAAWAPMKKSGSNPVRRPPWARGEKQCCAWNLYELKPTPGKHTINVLDPRVANRVLGLHYALIRTGPRIAAASS
jgi:hypothetical protein